MKNHKYHNPESLRRIRVIKKGRNRKQIAHYAHFLEEQIERAFSKIRSNKPDEAKRLLLLAMPEDKATIYNKKPLDYPTLNLIP